MNIEDINIGKRYFVKGAEYHAHVQTVVAKTATLVVSEHCGRYYAEVPERYLCEVPKAKRWWRK